VPSRERHTQPAAEPAAQFTLLFCSKLSTWKCGMLGLQRTAGLRASRRMMTTMFESKNKIKDVRAKYYANPAVGELEIVLGFPEAGLCRQFLQCTT
jgi:hypothetical protein